jgi:hypothetical protein
VGYSADYKPIVKDVDSATMALRILDDPFRRSAGPIGLKPGIQDKVCHRQNSSGLVDLSHRGRNKSERRAKPGKRPIFFAKRLRDRLIASDKILIESIGVPQIGKPMVERVIYQKMPRGGDGTCLRRPGDDLATHKTEARLYFEFVQNAKQVICYSPGRTIVERKQAMPEREATLVASNKDGSGQHAFTGRPGSNTDQGKARDFA